MEEYMWRINHDYDGANAKRYLWLGTKLLMVMPEHHGDGCDCTLKGTYWVSAVADVDGKEQASAVLKSNDADWAGPYRLMRDAKAQAVADAQV